MKSKINIIIAMSILTLSVLIIKQLTNRSISLSGEPSYAITLIALERGLTDDIIEEDIAKAKLDFPEFANEFSTDRLYKKVMKGDREVYRGYYVGTYSLAVIPAKKILSLLNISQSYAFTITNVIVLASSIILFIYMINIKLIKKIISLILITFNPILFYISWQSGEVFIYSMLIISLTFFIKNRYKSAFVFAALASTLNITLIFYMGVIGISYLIEKYREIESTSILNKGLILIKKNWIELTYFFILTMFSIISFLAGQTEKLEQNIVGNGLVSRLLAYIFDLNIGIMPYYGITMCTLLIASIKMMKKKNIKFWLLIISFLTVAIAYSAKTHINSGASGIARYNAWNVTFLIFALIIYINVASSKKGLFYCLIGGISTLIVVFMYGAWIPSMNDYEHFMPPAKFVLDKFPRIYNINEAIFAGRVLHSEGIGYENLRKPICNVNSEGYVTKMLVRRDLLDELDNYVTIEKNKLEQLKQNNKQNKKDFIFVNFSPKENITRLIKGGDN